MHRSRQVGSQMKAFDIPDMMVGPIQCKKLERVQGEAVYGAENDESDEKSKYCRGHFLSKRCITRRNSVSLATKRLQEYQKNSARLKSATSAAGDLDTEWEEQQLICLNGRFAWKLELRLTESNDEYAGYLTGTKVILGQK